MFVSRAGGAQADTTALAEMAAGEETSTVTGDSAQLVCRSASGADVTFCGQFNPTRQSFDDVAVTKRDVVDNGDGNARLGFRIVQPLENVTLRWRPGTGPWSRNTAGASRAEEPRWVDWPRTRLRWHEVATDADRGTLSRGQGRAEADGAAGRDSSFIHGVSPTGASGFFGAGQFRDNEGNLTCVTEGRVNLSFDVARRIRLRCDTPGLSDVAPRRSGDFAGVSVETAVGYGLQPNEGSDDEGRSLGARPAFDAPSGPNPDDAAGSRIGGPQHDTVKAGWRAEFIPQGKTALSVDYDRGTDVLSEGAETEKSGIGAEKSWGPLGQVMQRCADRGTERGRKDEARA